MRVPAAKNTLHVVMGAIDWSFVQAPALPLPSPLGLLGGQKRL